MAKTAQDIINFLASMPGLGNDTVTKKQMQEILLVSSGQFTAGGYLWEITSKHLGAGVYRVCSKRWPSK